MHKSTIKNIPLSPTFPYIYYSTAEFPIYALKLLTLLQKLQLQVFVCLFRLQKGFKAPLHFVHIGQPNLISFGIAKKGE
jgi:hypothetical protein